jgi:hypothetical protein
VRLCGYGPGPPARPGRLRGLHSGLHSESVFCGAIVWSRRALTGKKWRSLARAAHELELPMQFRVKHTQASLRR